MNGTYLRKTLLASLTMTMLASAAAMAAPGVGHTAASPTGDGSVFTTLSRSDDSSAQAPLPWYDSGFSSRAQLEQAIQNQQYNPGGSG